MLNSCSKSTFPNNQPIRCEARFHIQFVHFHLATANAVSLSKKEEELMSPSIQKTL